MGIVELLLDRGADVNTVGGRYGTALTAAASVCDIKTVKLLLDRGADVNTVGGRYGTALTAAASVCDIKTVELLLDQGADANTVAGEYGTALNAAAYFNNTEIVRLLLDRGADVSIIGGKYGTPLAMNAGGEERATRLRLGNAASHRDEIHEYRRAIKAMENTGILLLARGAKINAASREYGTALTTAVSMDCIASIIWLLDRGADTNIVAGDYGTALTAAAFHGQAYFISLLLAKGADVNIVGGNYGTALTAAILNEKKYLLSMLLARGADVNIVGGNYGTALTAAAFKGYDDIMSLLLEGGADVNIVGGNYGTALTAAAFNGRAYFLSLLLAKGADVNIVGGNYGTALTAAAFNGKDDIIPLLLERGADVNIVGGDYGTALTAAVFKGNNVIMSLLLERGADVNIVGGDYGTALTAAVFKGNNVIMSLLLERGADVNIVGGKYGTPLAIAAARGNTWAASLLLRRGADVNTLVDEHANTLLNVAACEGIPSAVSRLLDRGIGVDTICGKYGTALAAAVSCGKTDTALLLLEHGADIMRADFNPNNSEISWFPFPLPYTGPYHHNSTSSSHSCNILSAGFQKGGSLTPEQANVPCQKLTEEALRNALAALIGLNKTILDKYEWIRYDLCYFVTHHFDFGLAYAAARVAWNQQSLSPDDIFNGRRQWHRHAQMLGEAQSKVIETDSNHSSSIQAQQLIVMPYSVMPRRLWDLKSNRVVDFRMLHAAQPTTESTPTFWAVTHSWTSDMTPVLTAINQFQWPVPLPKGISIESLRSELLTLGAEYVWLDVICLRQRSELDSLEQLRQKEWKLDVPTIGNIYRTAEKIVRYFNGLGVPFSNDGWDGPQHWLCRAWTLQEIASEKDTINGSIPRDRSQRWVFLNSQGMVSGKMIKFRSAISPIIQLAAQVDSKYGCEIYELAREMARRQSTQPVDKLSGLFYLLRTTKLPCYNEHKTSEDIWRESFHLLPLERRAEILFDFPYRGSDEQWFPTWTQVLDWPTRDPEFNHMRPHISHDLVIGEIFLIRNIWTIPGITLYESNYPGEYGAETNGRLFGFYPPYLEQKPIDIQDPVFTLATLDIGHAYNWVVCKAIEKKTGQSVGLDGVAEVNVLKKIGVLRTDACSELMVGGQNGASLLQKMDCLFV